MDLDKIPMFKAMSRRMAWLTERQQVLAENVANADTPNYRARDLKAPSFADLVGKSSGNLHLAATQPGHLTAANGASSFRTEVDTKTELSPSGNNVVIENQMLKVSGTATDYQLTTSLYTQHLAMLKTVLGRGQ
jgi:flagellar basal-body rod protein FlgB